VAGELAPAQALYRDPQGDQLTVFQLSMLWGASQDKIKEAVGRQKFEELEGMFVRGSFDKDLAAATKLKDENFQVARLAFMQHFFEAQQESDTPQTSQVKEVEFKLFKLKLVQEQNHWKSHLMRVHEWHTKTHEAKHNLNSTLHALRQECVETHCSDRFPTCICSETREATLAVASRVLVSPASTGAHYSPSLVQRSYWACREARKCKLLCRWRRRSMPSCRAWQMAGACPGTASTRCTSRTSLALGQVMQAIVST